MSGKKILEMELFVFNGANPERFATLEGPFEQCIEDDDAREEFAEGRWHRPKVARAPFPTDPADLVVSCVE